MKNDPKNAPIPVRFDPEVEDKISTLSRLTGIGKAEIVRKAVAYTLEMAKENGSIEFLIGDEDQVRHALSGPMPTSRAAEDPAEYRVTPKAAPKKKTG